MPFHAPLDDVQWNLAAGTHRKMRSNLRRLRQKFAPRTPDEADVLKKYRGIIQEFGRELLKPLDRIDADKLNQLNEAAVVQFVVYRELRSQRH